MGVHSVIIGLCVYEGKRVFFECTFQANENKKTPHFSVRDERESLDCVHKSFRKNEKCSVIYREI